MSSTRVDMTHPKIPGSRYSAFVTQVDLWKARGWEVVTGDKHKPDHETPAKKPATKSTAAAPTDTPKEH